MMDKAWIRILSVLKRKRNDGLIARVGSQIPDKSSGSNHPEHQEAPRRFYTCSLSLLKWTISRAHIVLPLLAIGYCMLFQRLRPYDLDNPWFLSFSYNMCNEHVNTDEFERVRFPSGMDGTHLFGRLAASAQCLALDESRWRPRDASIVTIVFVMASLGFWWGALRRLGYSSVFVGCFIFLLGVWEPTINMSGQFRYEFFSFFLMSLAFWLATFRLAVPALIVAFLATETEPAALVAVVPTILLLHLHSSSKLRLILRTLVAALVAGGAYVWLHPYAIQSMLRTQEGLSWNPFSGGLIAVYFVSHPRHLPELVALVVGGVLFWINRAQIAQREIGYIAAFVAFFFLLMPHPNPYYMSLALPFPLLAALLGYRQSKQFAWVLAGVTGLMLGSYVYRAQANAHQGYDAADIILVGDLIRQEEQALQLRDKDAQIVGDWSLWYAHPHNYLSSYARTADVALGDIYLCDEQAVWRWGSQSVPEQVSCASLEARIRLKVLAHLQLRGRQLSLYRRVGAK